MNKLLGQHFLKNPSAIKKIISSLGIVSGEVILEIGPGQGALTIPLVKEAKDRGASFLCIEKDQKLALDLKREHPDINILVGDALEDLEKISKDFKNWKLVGNIPYYISGQLFRLLGDLKNKPRKIVLTIQKEVAERVSATPPNTNLLGAAVQIWGTPKLIFKLSPKDFHPEPDVDSAIIEIVTNQSQSENSSKYYQLVKAIFKQPRKTIFNNLRSFYKDREIEIGEKLKKNSLDLNLRPQNLSIEDLIKLSKEF